MHSAIMTSPDFGEVCFLIALILFAIAFVVNVTRSEIAAWSNTIIAAGLAFIALAWLAL